MYGLYGLPSGEKTEDKATLLINKERELISNADRSEKYWKQKLAMQISWLYTKAGHTWAAGLKLSWSKVRGMDNDRKSSKLDCSNWYNKGNYTFD